MSDTNHQSAERIIKAIADKKLISADGLATITKNFASGKMTASEWQVIAKLETQKPAPHAAPKA